MNFANVQLKVEGRATTGQNFVALDLTFGTRMDRDHVASEGTNPFNTPSRRAATITNHNRDVQLAREMT